MSSKRKIAVILCDGMSDYPDQNGNTPMMLASKPTMDSLAKISEVGLSTTVPLSLSPGSDVANLSVMGYDPSIYYSGRSPLEALSIGIQLNECSITYRANLVTLTSAEPYQNKIMTDYSAGEISTAEANQLIQFLAQNLFTTTELKIYSGVSYRHCLVRDGGKTGAQLTPPHDISDKAIADYLPTGENSKQLLSLMQQSYQLLSSHPINIQRVKNGKNPANSVWFWGEGTKPKLDNFKEKFGISGAVISAVDLIKGIGIGAGMQSINVEGATGTVHTNFSGKAQAAITALKSHDYVYIHIEAPDECGHQGDKAGKIKSIELIDSLVIKPLHQHLADSGIPYAIMVIPDHATPLALKTHTRDAVPYLIYFSDKQNNGVTPFNEYTAKQKGSTIAAPNLLPHIINS